MNIAVIGLGYVGTVSAACFARDGHKVIGVDINPSKLEILAQGKSPIIERGLDELISDAILSAKFETTDDIKRAVRRSEILMICVGTPSRRNGAIDLSFVENVCIEIGRDLQNYSQFKTIVIRSTMLPGNAQDVLIPAIEEVSLLAVGTGFGFCVNPEFLREGSAVSDFDNPPFTVIGEHDSRSGELLAELYSNLDTPTFRVSLGVGEMIKYASNSFHALKVTFANEIGRLCKSYGLDSHEVMNIFKQDKKLNLSESYLLPGYAFGGSCLPKDLRAMLYAARQNDVKMPVIESILPSNEIQVIETYDIINDFGKKKIGLVGLSFKPNTDDLRESPALELAEKLLGKGYDISIYDREIALGALHGSNRDFIIGVIPHISSLLNPNLSDTIANCDVVVVTKNLSRSESEELDLALNSDHVLIDLVRLNEQILQKFEGHYYGIGW